MRAYRERPKPGVSQPRDPVIAAYLDETNRKFGRYARSAEETRKLVDRDMGDVTLTELLHRDRAAK